MTQRDYSLPQSCPSDIDPHLPNTCEDPEHAILAMSETEYTKHLSASPVRALAEQIRIPLTDIHHDQIKQKNTPIATKENRRFTTKERDEIRAGAIALGETKEGDILRTLLYEAENYLHQQAQNKFPQSQ